MEVSIAVTKKKKRKTRKCLDELRKRSRHTLCSDYLGETPQQHAKAIKARDHVISHRLLAMNRLTLNMFPKAIRSETITRPLLEEIKSKYNTYQDLDKNIKCASSPKDQQIECFQCSATNNSMPMFDLNKSLHERGSRFIDATLGNSQSPVQMNILESPADLTAKIYSTSSTSLAPGTLQEHAHELYEELMNKISSHLKNITSAVIEEDLIKTTKVKLIKLYNRSWKEEYQTCLLEYEKSNKLATIQTSKDYIAQNSLDYISLSDIDQEGLYDDRQSIVSKIFNSPSAAEAAPVAAVSHLPLTFASECTHNVALYDTPEYNYYPHRLI